MTAADLTLVGLSEDGAHLLLDAPDGERYRVRLDAALRAAVRQDHRRPDEGPRPDMSPREVQALIRAGASVDEVAELSGWTRDKIDKYEGPILAEREFVASLATQVRLRSGSGTTLLATRVAERLAQRGVDPAAASWDAWRAAGRPWTLQLAFPAGGRLREAVWAFDVPTRAVTPEDDEARWLSGEDGPSARPAPFVPLSSPHAASGPAPVVYDVVADGGLEPAATTGPAPVPDLAPERPRTAARRHEGEQDADLERSMRERSKTRRRRPKAAPAVATPVAAAPVAPEPATAAPTAPAAASEPPVSELGAAVDAVLAAAVEEGRDPAAEVVELDSTGSSPAPDEAAQAPTIDDDETSDISPTAADQAEETDPADGIVADALTGTDDDAETVSDDSPRGEAQDEHDAADPAPLDDAVDALVEQDEASADTGAEPAQADGDPVDPAPLDDAVDALVDDDANDETEAEDVAGEQASPPAPATAEDPGDAAADEDSRPAAAPETPDTQPATGRAARRAASGKRKGRASVPSWDDIMFGPKA